MKLGPVILIFGYLLIHQPSVKGEALPQILGNAQVQTDHLHSFLSSVLLNFRMEMTKILSTINTQSLSHILNALERAQMLSGNDLEAIGKKISRCSAQADHDIQEAIKQFFDVFSPAHRNSTQMLNTVLQEIRGWDQISDPVLIVTSVQDILNDVRAKFISETVPGLENKLKELKNSSTLISTSTELCVSESLK